ncbi:DUF1801 domain-containing protein [Microbacterium sp. 179-I 1D1 NHS]|uniref:DUF1801 domain-containing protein n=1 Tax=Microbacterium sp. 179-I 1D1 NHS TaxID=3374298 RepID=UPI0038790E1C
MERTGRDVDEFLAEVAPSRRRTDAEALVALMREVSGRAPEMWSGSIVGFGACRYRYASGTEGEMPLLGFSPRRAATTIYLDRADAHADSLARLGPHTTGASCLYVKDLDAVDRDVLRGILSDSQRRLVEDELPGATITVLE